MSKIHRLLSENDLILDSPFWESPNGSVLVLQNLSIGILLEKVEMLMPYGYKLTGGVQIIRRDNGDINGCVTLLAENR